MNKNISKKTRTRTTFDNIIYNKLHFSNKLYINKLIIPVIIHDNKNQSL